MQHFLSDRRNFPGGHPSRDYSMASTLNYGVPIHMPSLKRVGQLLKDPGTWYLYTRELRSVTVGDIDCEGYRPAYLTYSFKDKYAISLLLLLVHPTILRLPEA